MPSQGTIKANPTNRRRSAVKSSPAPKAGPIGPFKNAIVVQEWDSGHKMVYIWTAEDMTILADHGGGCSGSHYVWTEVADPIGEFFFVMVKPDGSVGVILFCKRAELWGKQHPQEAKMRKRYEEDFQKKCENARHGQYIPHYYIESDLYDARWPAGDKGYRNRWRYGDAGDVAGCEKALAQAKEKYEEYKRQAIEAHGPLGRNHPMKHRVDMYNREVTHFQRALEQAKLRAKVSEGMTFKYDGVEVFIIEIAGRGMDYDGTNTRYTDKIVEFIAERQ